MALVGVEHLGGGGTGEPGERADRPHAADAEQHLLAQPVLGVAAVQAVGDGADDLAVLLHVGVEQQQRDAADLGDPDAGGQRLLVGQADDDLGDRAVVLAQQRQRQAVGVEDRVGLLLPAVAGQRLAEVAVPVEQPDADDRHAEVAGGLEVVAGQDAETAGVLRQHRGDAELRGEVADGRGQRRLRGGVLLVPPRPGHVLLEVRAGRGEPAEEVLVGGQLVQTGRRHGAEEPHRVVARGLPRTGVDGREEVLGLGVPGPAQVACQLAERVQRLGQDGTDGEPTDCSHRSTIMQIDLNDPIFASSPVGRPCFGVSAARYVRAMVGRIPVMDVSPVVEGGRYPAKAAVGESFSVSATIFREGHDELNADVVVVGPDGARRPPVRMSKDATEPDIWHASFTPDAVGALDVRDRVLERPGRHLAPQRRDQDPGRHRRGPDVHRGRPAARAARRRAAEALPRPQDGRRRAQGAARHPPPGARCATPRPSPPRSTRCSPSTRCATWSPPRVPTRSSPTGSGRCSPPGTSSSRAPRAPTSTRRPARSCPAPCPPRRSGSTRSPRWASTSSTSRRSTRSAG